MILEIWRSDSFQKKKEREQSKPNRKANDKVQGEVGNGSWMV